MKISSARLVLDLGFVKVVRTHVFELSGNFCHQMFHRALVSVCVGIFRICVLSEMETLGVDSYCKHASLREQEINLMK